MNEFWSFVDYFMDFEKVRAFQELCGLRALDLSVHHEEPINGHCMVNDVKKCDDQCESDIMHDHCSKNVDCNDEMLGYQEHSECSGNEVTVKEKKQVVSTQSVIQTYEVTNWFLYYLFRFGSALGQETFYITFIPFIFWNLDPFVGRKMVVVWVVTMYIGQTLKDIIRWPRPTWPPVFKLEARVQAEYGIPSTHAVAGTALPFSFLMAMYGRYEFSLDKGILLACSWCLLVALSRLYVGMHSILDVLAGTGIAAVYLWLGWPFMDMVEEYTMKSTYAPAIIILSHFLLGLFYPNTSRYSTSRGDTVIILGVGAGIHVATWMCFQYGVQHGPSGEPPFPLDWPTWSSLTIDMYRAAVGLFVLYTVRFVFKRVSIYLVCMVVGARRNDRNSARRKEVEVGYKFITYAAVGFAVLGVVPFLLDSLNITYD